MDLATLIGFSSATVSVFEIVSSWRTRRARQRDAVFERIEAGDANWNIGNLKEAIAYLQQASELEIKYRCLSEEEETHLFCNAFGALTYRHYSNALRYWECIPRRYQWLPEVQSNLAFYTLNTRRLGEAYQQAAYLLMFDRTPEQRSGELARLIQLGPQTKSVQVYPVGMGYRPPVAVLLSTCLNESQLTSWIGSFELVESMLGELGPGSILAIVAALKRAKHSRFSQWFGALEKSLDQSPNYDEAHRQIALGRYHFMNRDLTRGIEGFREAFSLNPSYTRIAIVDTQLLFPDMSNVASILAEEFSTVKPDFVD